MTAKLLCKIEDLYSNNLKEFGVSSKSVGWPDPNDHILRFDKLLNYFNLKEPFSLNDLGCGYGAVLDYFLTNNLPIKKYFGYDISQEMLDSLDTAKYPNIELSKICSPQLSTIADYSIASGIFNVRFAENDDSWHSHILKTLENINAFSTKGFSFNLLTSYVDFKVDHLYYGDPLFFFDHCKKNFSRHVSLIHDYNLWEWTIVVSKL